MCSAHTVCFQDVNPVGSAQRSLRIIMKRVDGLDRKRTDILPGYRYRISEAVVLMQMAA